MTSFDHENRHTAGDDAHDYDRNKNRVEEEKGMCGWFVQSTSTPTSTAVFKLNPKSNGGYLNPRGNT